ncbi:MAG: hypothetical protein HUJ95_03905 [Bacteroidales bacterium]|nr:hypothetical protein [Bacteroidales bacterium]
MVKKSYSSPTSELILLRIERGFAASNDGLEDFNRGGSAGSDDGDYGLE